MKYEIKGKKINIPDQEIEKSMKLLDITQEQAIEMYLCDHDYIKNEEVETLTKKAKASGADKIVNKAKTTRAKTERKPKENPLKTSILNCLHKALIDNSEMLNISPIVQTSKGIDLYINEKYFTITLTEHRPPKAKSE